MGTEGGFCRTRKEGRSARGNICEPLLITCHKASNVCMTYLDQTVELGADGFDAFGDANGVVEDRLRRIYLVRAL